MGPEGWVSSACESGAHLQVHNNTPLARSLLGTLAGPLVVGSVAGHYSLNVAAQFVSLLLAACALGYALFGLETLHAPHARRAAPGASVELRVARAG